MRTFFKFLIEGSSNFTLSIVVFLGALSGLTGAVLIAVISRIFTNSANLNHNELIRYAILLAALVLASLIIDLVAKWYLLKFNAARHRNLHITFSRVVLNDSLRRTEQTGIARLITIYAEDMSIIGIALNQLASFGVSFFIVLGCLAYLSTISFSILCITLLVGIIAGFGYRIIHMKSVNLARSAFNYRDRHVSLFKDLVHGIGELKLSYRKRREYLDLDYLPTVFGHERLFIKSYLMHLFANTWIQLVFFALMISILIFIAINNYDPTVLGPFLVVALFMRSHVSGIISAIPSWSRAGITLERMHKQGYTDLHRARILDQAPPLPEPKNGDFKLDIEELTWRYTSETDDSTFTVGPISTSMCNGEIIFLVGHNGAGKTTFAKLLSGLYPNETGRLSYNGIEINDSNRTSYNELFSMLFSEPFIFDRLTLSEDQDNTAVSAIKTDPSESQHPSTENNRLISNYLEKLQLHHKVTVENQQLSSTRLSGGQRKRLALLAAYLEDKPIMIFDEWAENQDPAFKQVFYNELLPELKARGKLVLVISHEAQFYGVADRLIELNAEQSGKTMISRQSDKEK